MDSSNPRPSRRAALATLAVSGSPVTSRAQGTYPDRAVRLFLPAAPGGAGDVVIRAVVSAASRSLGQPFIPDHRPGAGGTLAARALQQARPDGHTLAAMLVTVFRMRLLFPHQVDFDPRSEFTWVIQLAGLLMGVVVRADSPWRSFREFLDHARANPGRISYGIPGANSTELPLEILAQEQGIEWSAIPFRAGTEALQALLGGQVDAIADTSGWMPHVEAGHLRLLVTYGDERAPRFREIPTLREFGINWPVDSAFGIVGPRGMDAAITRKLHDALRPALSDPTVVSALERYHMSVAYLGSDDYAREAVRLFDQERDVLQRLRRLPPS